MKSSTSDRRTADAGLLRRELAPHVLAPGTRHRAQIDDDLARLEQVQFLVNLLELVSGTGPVALFLRQLDVGVVHVVMEPALVDLLALGLGFHDTEIIEG